MRTSYHEELDAIIDNLVHMAELVETAITEASESLLTADLARALKLEPGWAAEVLRMTLLAPDIVEAILDGRQPRHLNLHTLRGRQDLLPRDWGEQRRLLGFPPPAQ